MSDDIKCLTNDDSSKIYWKYKDFAKRLLKPPAIPTSIRMIRSNIYEKFGDLPSYQQVKKTIKEY